MWALDRLASRWDRLRCANGDITDTILTPALRTAITGLTGLQAACSWARGRGSMVRVGWEAGAGLTDGMDVRGTDIRAGAVNGMATADGTVNADSSVAALSVASTVRDSAAAFMESVGSMAVADSMEVSMKAAGSTVVEAFTVEVDSMVEADSTADADNGFNA